MKILLVNKYLYPKGGAETYVLNLGSYLTELGHEVQYFGMADPRNTVGNRLGLAVSPLDFSAGVMKNLHAPFRMIYSAEASGKLTRVLRDFQPEVVHVNNIHYHLTPSVLLAADRHRRKTGRPMKILYTAHDYQLVCPSHGLFDGKYALCEDCLGGSFRHCIRRRCVKGSYLKSALAALDACIWRGSRAYEAIDTIICCSAYLKQKLDTDPLLRQKTVVLHNFAAVSPAASAEKGDYVLMFGHLSRQKGAYTLLEAAKRMPETSFVFAGTGEAAAEIRKLPNCRYAGFLTGDALRDLVARAKVTVYPSQWPENCPLSVIESMSLGTPVIGSDMGGIPELIRPGKTGELFPAGDVSALESALRALLENPEILEKYQKNCGPGDFETRETYVRKMLKLYESL